ncbi:MAG: monovalent cation/H(+) antiporter subunit G [Actinomycetota bacterium]|nr:monovalent cation/H(+) antiporter subunit G [Actinomycetota bacterium]
MTIDSLLDAAAGVCLVLGAFLSLAAGVGLLRFPDVLSRMHAATKPQILGLLFVIAAVAISARSWTILLALTPVVVFQLATAPIAAHMIGRAAYRSGHYDRPHMLIDELHDANERGDGPGAGHERRPTRGKRRRPGGAPKRRG